MSVTIDIVCTSDRNSKPALGLFGESLGQRLYTMKFAEMLDTRDWTSAQPNRIRRKAIKQARNLPEHLGELRYDPGLGEENFTFNSRSAILVVAGEKISVGGCVYKMQFLWAYDNQIGGPDMPHVGYVSEIHGGKGAVIDFTTDDPVVKVGEAFSPDGYLLTYENRYTKEREFRFRFFNGKNFNLVTRNPDTLLRIVKKEAASGYWD